MFEDLLTDVSSGLDSAFNWMGNIFGGSDDATSADMIPSGDAPADLSSLDMSGSNIPTGTGIPGDFSFDQTADPGTISDTLPTDGSGFSLGTVGTTALGAAMKTFGGSNNGGGGGSGTRMETQPVYLQGKTYLRPKQADPPQKSRPVQSENPEATWLKWYQMMQQFAYKGK